ncbi:MAG: M3 family metallopeptidase [Candidatus Marinimicrobia bacterium]|nr:M3 family metallopeptidase [Candidatus Neomarinimicrobiota bacterium]MBL7009730.1 M3 family metallopeptidase [Candidatus Neomarinimicrobiota bacterium]MBL7029866.1 M3 family metallopeptidase [Candidatus Neomarinimicrobiota bacterium]
MKQDIGSQNPFYTESPLYMKFPQFDHITNEHYGPAFEKGMADHMAEIDAIAQQADSPTLENTIIAMEKSGALLDRVATVFFALTSANTNDEMEKIRSEMAPKLSAHSDQILLNGKLFQRVKSIYEQRFQLGLEAESQRLVEKYYNDFIRAGANLSDADKEALKKINGEMAVLQTTFSQNVLKEVNALAVVVDSKDDLDGLSDAAIEAAANEATSRKLEGKFVLTLRNTSGQPPMASLTNRALRERIHKTSLSRGSRGGDYDNRDALANVIKLRAERAQLMGYNNHAAYSLENQTAQTPNAVNERLSSLAPKAVANAEKEAADLQRMIIAEGGSFKLASWDWDFYTEKVRADRYNFDAAQLKPYLEMDNVLQNGVFFAATQLFGITFKERFDLPVYQEDVRVFEVFNEDGSVLALFLFDGYARSSKRGGAWMNAYVAQSKLKGTQPVIANHLNVTKPPEGEPTLMTFDEVITMFHEFGHALHGMFSDVNYPYFAGTSVPRDFVEYPSQVNEMWAVWPEVLKNYAVHHETGEAMPKELLEKVLATQKFNQGFATTEYLAASLLDQALHQLTPDQVPTGNEIIAFETDALKTAGVAMDVIPPRYRSTYFSHIIGGYSAGYYSYIWSEVLDADTVKWFKENGGLKRENGDHFRKTLLSRGGSDDALKIFKDFRGADPNIQPLLDRRGLN